MAGRDNDDDRRARVAEVLEEGAALRRATLDTCADAIVAAASIFVDRLRAGHRVLAFGNGGSAADAQHFAAELTGRYERDRPGLPAIALGANSSDVTAIGNDFGFDQVFARLVEAHGAAGDVAVAISTSGDSPNVLEGVGTARARGLHTIGLVGRGGGKLAGAVDVPIVVPSDRTPRIQEVHIAVIHLLCELVEEALFPAPPGH